MVNFAIGQYMVPTLIALSSIFWALLLNVLGSKILKNIVSRTDNRLYTILFQRLRNPVSILVAFLGIYIAILNIESNFFSIYYIQGFIFTILVFI